MRCFVGLDIQAKQKLELQNWCKNSLPEVRDRDIPAKARADNASRESRFPVAVPAANYHVTLCFLGSVTERQHDALIQALAEIKSQPFSLQFNQTGYWNGPKILFIQPADIPGALVKLEKDVRKAAREANIETESREYKPHVTLVRKASASLPPPLFPPDINCEFTSFHLFESVSGRQGVHYPVRHSWPLQGTLTMREQLRQGLI